MQKSSSQMMILALPVKSIPLHHIPHPVALAIRAMENIHPRRKEAQIDRSSFIS
jgi:hypothetical protein